MRIHLGEIQKIKLYPVSTASKLHGLIAEILFPAEFRERPVPTAAICTVQHLCMLFSPSGINTEWGKLGEQDRAGYFIAAPHKKEELVVIEIMNRDWNEGKIVKFFSIIWLLSSHWKWEVEERPG